MIHDYKVFKSQGSGCFDVRLGYSAAVVKNNPDQRPKMKISFSVNHRRENDDSNREERRSRMTVNL